MDDKISSLAAARFNKNTDPAAHDAATALDVAYECIKELGEDEKPDHIIVIIGRHMPNGFSGTRFFQAGKFCYHAQYGLCAEGMQMIRDSGT